MDDHEHVNLGATMSTPIKGLGPDGILRWTCIKCGHSGTARLGDLAAKGYSMNRPVYTYQCRGKCSKCGHSARQGVPNRLDLLQRAARK